MSKTMLAKSLLYPILEDESLTRGLGDAEARMLIDWLVDRVEHRCQEGIAEDQVRREIQRLCRWARVVSRFVRLWCLDQDPGAANQLLASERLDFPLPTTPLDPCDLMLQILHWKDQFPI